MPQVSNPNSDSNDVAFGTQAYLANGSADIDASSQANGILFGYGVGAPVGGDATSADADPALIAVDPAPSGVPAHGNQNIRLPDGDVVLPDGTILSGDGTGPISYIPSNADYQKAGSQSSWKAGDRSALEALLSNENPSAVTYDTSGFDPTAAPNLSFGYGIDNSVVNAEIAKSPIMTAELNEALARGESIQFTLDGGEYDEQNNLITIPAAYADSPDQIVSTLAHELGHAMWGDVMIPQSQALQMGEQQFVGKQVSLELQNEGVATINNIAVSEQIWGDSPTAIYDHVAGATSDEASEKFGTDYTLFSSGSDTLEQAASDIGAFYATNERPANDLIETYQTKYTRDVQESYGIYSGHAEIEAKNQALRAELQKLESWRKQIISGQRSDLLQYNQALRAYEQSNGGGK